MTDREIRPAGRYEWEQIVRRARLGSLIAGSGRIGSNGRATRGGMTELTFTAIALCWATYADDKGQDIWAGDATLAVDLGTSIDNVSKVRRKLIELGMLTFVRGRRRDRGDEYRLTLPSDLLDVVKVPTPAQHRLAAMRLRDAARGKPKGSSGGSTPSGSGGPVDPPGPVDNSALGGPVDTPKPESAGGPGGSGGPPEIGSGGSGGGRLGGPVEAHTDHDRTTTTTDHSGIAVRTAVTVARASPAAEEPIPIKVKCSSGCAKGYRLADGQIQRCPVCAKPDTPPDPDPPPGGGGKPPAPEQRTGADPPIEPTPAEPARPQLSVIRGGAAA